MNSLFSTKSTILANQFCSFQTPRRNLGNYPQQEQSSSDNWHVNINSNSYLGLAETLKDMSRLLKSPPHLSLSDDTQNLFYCLANADDNFDKS